MQAFMERNKKIVQVVVGVIIAVSVVGNGWALWSHYVTKAKDAARMEGWQSFATQLITQSDGCKAVTITTADGKNEQFVNTKCLAAPGGAAAPGAPAGGAAATPPAR